MGEDELPEGNVKHQRQALIAEIGDLADEYVRLSRQAVAIAWRQID